MQIYNPMTVYIVFAISKKRSYVAGTYASEHTAKIHAFGINREEVYTASVIPHEVLECVPPYVQGYVAEYNDHTDLMNDIINKTNLKNSKKI